MGKRKVQFEITIKKFDRKKTVGDYEEITYSAKLENCCTDGCMDGFSHVGISDKNKLKEFIRKDFKRHFKQKHPDLEYSVSFRDG